MYSKMSQRISKSRKSTHSIMEHSGFGSVTLIKSGLKFVVPQSCLDSIGNVRRGVANFINGSITVRQAEMLNSLGIEITSA